MDNPRCDCGYVGVGATLDERISDARSHAAEAHGIDVTADQILANPGGQS